MLKELITLGTKASTGSGMEPWGFVTLKGKEEIDMWSEKIKSYLLDHFEEYPYLHQYESWLKNPKFSIFNHASTLMTKKKKNLPRMLLFSLARNSSI